MITIQPEIWGWFSLIIAVISYVPYFVGIFAGRTKPHAFSWFIWAVLTLIAFFAQRHEGAGSGAWATGFTGTICLLVFFSALIKGEHQITKSDVVTFIAALLAIPLWWFTKNPLYSVILVTIIDLLGFYPTFRKSWLKPQEENPFTYTLSGLKFAVALFALATVNWTTALFPTSLVISNFAFVIMILWRRKMLKG